MLPLEIVVIVALACFVVVQPWIPFASPGGAQRFARLPEEDAREALDRAVRWDRMPPSQRNAAQAVVGALAVLALLAGFVAGFAWLAAAGSSLAILGLAVQVRRRGLATVVEAARARAIAPTARTRSATRSSQRRVLAAVMAAALVAAPLAYRSDGFGPISAGFATGALVIAATVALVGLLATNDRTYGDEEPD